MKEYIDDKRFLIITEPKTNCFDLPIDVNNSLEHEIKFFIKDYQSSVEQRITNIKIN